MTTWELRDLLRAYTDADLVVGCPGNIFASTGRVGKTLVISALTVAYALLLGKPFYVLPQSIGPLREGWPRRVTGALYRRARLVFAREPLSFRVGQELGLKPERLRLAPDLAFALPPAPRAEAQTILKRLGLSEGPCLGVTVINRLLRTVDDRTWDRYEASVAYALRRFMVENEAHVVFLPQVTGPTAREDDREAARRVVAAMGDPPAAVVLDDILPPAVLKALCGEMDAFVATRMHSAIFALGMGVPTLMIEYLAKTRGLAEMLGLESWRLDLTEVEPDRLVDALDRLWRERDAYRRRLAETIPPLAAAASDVGRMIAQDFYGR
jgi:colanic acid/amylovoran biosynthesis protein